MKSVCPDHLRFWSDPRTAWMETGLIAPAPKEKLTVSVTHLVLVEEGLLGLVDLAGEDLAGAGGARAGAARVGKVDAGLLGGVDDEDVVGALEGLVDVVLLGDDLDGVAEAGLGPGGGVDGGEGGGRGEEGGEGDEAEHGER